MKKIILAATLLGAVALAGCSSGSAYPAAAPATSAPASTSPSSTAGGHDLATVNTSLGMVIVDGNGMTAFVYAKDVAGSGRSACVGACLAAWPPITAAATPPSVAGVTGKVGTITTQGKTQVTVNGLPIYTNAQDHGPGEVSGQGMLGLWHVIAPDGTVIGAPGSSANGGY